MTSSPGTTRRKGRRLHFGPGIAQGRLIFGAQGILGLGTGDLGLGLRAGESALLVDPLLDRVERGQRLELGPPSSATASLSRVVQLRLSRVRRSWKRSGAAGFLNPHPMKDVVTDTRRWPSPTRRGRGCSQPRGEFGAPQEESERSLVGRPESVVAALLGQRSCILGVKWAARLQVPHGSKMLWSTQLTRSMRALRTGDADVRRFDLVAGMAHSGVDWTA